MLPRDFMLKVWPRDDVWPIASCLPLCRSSPRSIAPHEPKATTVTGGSLLAIEPATGCACMQWIESLARWLPENLQPILPALHLHHEAVFYCLAVVAFQPAMTHWAFAMVQLLLFPPTKPRTAGMENAAVYGHLYENGERHAAVGAEIYRAVLREVGLNMVRKFVEIRLSHY